MRLQNPKYLIFVPLLLLFLASHVFAAKNLLTGKAIKITDGDTVVISQIEGGAFFKYRFYGIDAPETQKTSKRGCLKKPGQPFGEESARELKRLILGEIVEVTLTGDKTYNIEVCRIYKDGIDVNLEMVKRGYAWAYRHYLHRPFASELY